ncbi:hypothetical protein BC832DRAFT_569599 [Gaertneriomyces semiglobifer]|nr:hypothetical protein BC832DRAFT_569599 [Gaertneriomyces semiglobifer]
MPTNNDSDARTSMRNLRKQLFTQYLNEEHKENRDAYMPNGTCSNKLTSTKLIPPRRVAPPIKALETKPLTKSQHMQEDSDAIQRLQFKTRRAVADVTTRRELLEELVDAHNRMVVGLGQQKLTKRVSPTRKEGHNSDTTRRSTSGGTAPINGDTTVVARPVTVSPVPEPLHSFLRNHGRSSELTYTFLHELPVALPDSHSDGALTFEQKEQCVEYAERLRTKIFDLMEMYNDYCDKLDNVVKEARVDLE